MTTGKRRSVPRWCARAGTLSWRGTILRRVRIDAVYLRCLLDAFEQQGWPEWIANPLPHQPGMSRKQRLRQTLENLNRGMHLPGIRFHADKGGVRWQVHE